MDYSQLASWATRPWVSREERSEAYASPSYKTSADFREACLSKEGITEGGPPVLDNSKTQRVTASDLGTPEEQAADRQAYADATGSRLAFHPTLGIKPREPAQLEADQQARDAAAAKAAEDRRLEELAQRQSRMVNGE